MSELDKLYQTHSLRKVGEIVGLSHGTVRTRLMAEGVQLRPRGGHIHYPHPPKTRADLICVGKWPDVLYKQGTCRGCSIPLYGEKKIMREWCGDCS